jgi:hypothetical protein
MITHLRSILPSSAFDDDATLTFVLVVGLLTGRSLATAAGMLAHANPTAATAAHTTFFTIRTPSARFCLPDTT